MSYKITTSKVTIFTLLFSFLYSILQSKGFYGFGTDYYAAYYKSNLDFGSWATQRLGWRIVTLTIFNFKLGVFINSFFLVVSTGLIIYHFIKQNKFSYSFFVLVLLIIIHTYPIIVSTTNAMRQGLAMSFIYLALVF